MVKCEYARLLLRVVLLTLNFQHMQLCTEPCDVMFEIYISLIISALYKVVELCFQRKLNPY